MNLKQLNKEYMKVLIIAVDYGGHFMPFVEEQIDVLKNNHLKIIRYAIKNKGFLGYLRELKSLKRIINIHKPDIIHAHYGLSGLLANLQRKVPVVTTFHGSDINNPKVLKLSKIAMNLSAWNIFVAKSNLSKVKLQKNYTLLPCGVDLDKLINNDSNILLINRILQPEKKHILFAGSFKDQVKDPVLAQKVVAQLYEKYQIDAQLIELSGYTRTEVTALMYACDVFLMTSKSEGSPQVIKEAMACGCPIVSVDVGDVKERLLGLQGCYVSNSRDENEIATILSTVLSYKSRTNGRERIIEMELTNDKIANKLIEIYNNVLKLK